MAVRITPAPVRPALDSVGASDGPRSETARKDSRGEGARAERTEYLAGEVIADRYKLVRPLGRGGMGVVWVAHSLVLGVDVALKLIHSDLSGTRGGTRMAREAHAAARLGHPAMVRVFDFGWTSRADPFLVMELVQGESLGSILRREVRLPAIQAVQVLLPLADGLRSAHDKGIVHRDVKPDNILIARDEFGRQQPKLLDFGIAKVDQSLANEDRKLTQDGVALGSPEYMSPEQASGRGDVDHRSDVWALCVVLYESITGKMPFDRPNYNALMQAIIHDGALPTTELSAGDPDLWRVIERGLQKNPEQRWSSMTELGEALALWLYEHGVKEDISANSLRAVWLDGTLSGVRMDLSSQSALRSAQGPVTGSDGSVVQGATREMATEQPALDSRRARASVPVRRWLWALGIGVALVLGLGAGLLFRGARAAVPPPADSPISERPTIPAEPPVIAEPAPTPVPATAVTAAKAPASSGTPGKAPPRVSPARTTPVGHPPANGKHYDFGF